ncbi:altered inheritance of mitochondria protein 6 [Dipodascopsis tothii]|uniref:altered inheritance of mitochondria protein 6 n=1 Tax=Dipodascopsis tothii TaxID=44089 RepID=UPI0034CF3CDD
MFSAKKLLLALIALGAIVPAAQATPIDQVILSKEGALPSLYSSDLTRNIFVKQIHSHNDYWRDIPLYTALSYGVQSVEADVWLYNGTLFVGHHEAALTSARTFASLYIDPLVDLLTQANPVNAFTADQATPNGVFDTDSTKTLYLFVDLKTEGNATWPYVLEALQPLRDLGYLSSVNGTTFTSGPVTVIGTGNTPADQVLSKSTRDYFVDAPVANLTGYSSLTSPIASGGFRSIVGDLAPSGMNLTQLALIKELIDGAHEKGIYTRFWDVPWWPVRLRNSLARQLIDLSSDFFNADDLQWASTLA